LPVRDRSDRNPSQDQEHRDDPSERDSVILSPRNSHAAGIIQSGVV
jgi:hypothetical protein